ncbi:MAG: dienelactone hydrolase family protein [Micavibrio sp.]|nr:dienelactone hydrolase family protein [Micavibrio sp.]
MTQGNISNSYEFGNIDSPKNLVILLHGLGSNGRDLISLAPMWAKNMPDTVFVSPDAPFACDMVPPGYPDSFQWFSLQVRDPILILQGVQTATPILSTYIKEQMEKYGVSADKTALVGFSQGTMMSLYAGMRFDQKLAGILGYSGALVGDVGNVQIPVHLVHGEADDVVPFDEYTRARKALEDAGVKVSGHGVAGLPHSIDPSGIESGAEFLRKALY